MSYKDKTIDSRDNLQISINTDPSDPNAGDEKRVWGDADGRPYVNVKAPRTPTQKSADAQVKASAGTLYGFVISFLGATIADIIEIRDSTSAGGGTVIFTIICATANETHEFVFPQGMTFSTGIYHDETKNSGTIYGTYVYE